MRKLCTACGRFFFACVLCMPLVAHAAQLEMGIGVARSNTHGDGTWYQSAFPHTLRLNSPVAQIGVVGDALPWLRWHVDAIYLGRYRVDSVDTPNDGNYAPGVGCKGACLPLTHYSGAGSIYGIAATLEAHTQGAWQWGIEAGPLLYHRTWAVSVPDWYPSVEVRPQVFAPSGTVSPVLTHDAGWSLGGVLGVSLTHKFSGHGADPWPPLWKGQTVLMLTHSF